MKVEIEVDFIRIYDENNKEIVGWHSDEWEEDATIVPSIANAIKLAYTDPELLKEKLKFF